MKIFSFGKYRIYVVLAFICLIFVLTLSLFSNPSRQVFSNISGYQYSIVIDPGHGGMDGGASSKSGIMEKNINLNIASKVHYLLRFFGVHTIMTRQSDISLNFKEGNRIRENKIADINARVDIVNSAENPFYLGIHLNNFTQSQYFGAQVFYKKGNLESKNLADKVQSSMIQILNKDNYRNIKEVPESILIVKKTTCPAIIAECGFLSNPEEAENLNKPSYQNKIAISILQGYFDFEAKNETLQ